MKKALLLFCFTFLLTSCNSQNNSSYQQGTDNTLTTTSKTTENTTASDTGVPVINNNVSFPFEENDENENSDVTIPELKKLSDSEINALNNTKCGYGQGRRLDENNCPYGALDFNAQFGKYDSIAINDTSKKTICLTFDQGYENGYTSKILDVLKEKNIKATFFLINDYEERNSELVKRMIDEGHTIGNHSVHHYSMPTLDINSAKNEIIDLHQKIKEKYGYEMFLFRPPMGEFSEKSLAVTQSCNYKTIMWSYAYADWDVNKQMAPSDALDKLVAAAHPGAIYLLHSVSSTNAQILQQLIDELSEQGYAFEVPQ